MSESELAARALTAEQEAEYRRVHVGGTGPHTSHTCYNCWQGTCPVPPLLATLDALRAAAHRPDVAGLREAAQSTVDRLSVWHSDDELREVLTALRAALAAADKLTPEPARDGDRPRLDPATVAHDSAYMAGLKRGRELEREAAALAASGDEALRTALKSLLDHMEELPARYTVIDPNTGRVKLNPDGSAYYEPYVRFTVGQSEVAVIRAALRSPAAAPATEEEG